jgi:hypothetical protein
MHSLTTLLFSLRLESDRLFIVTVILLDGSRDKFTPLAGLVYDLRVYMKLFLLVLGRVAE